MRTVVLLLVATAVVTTTASAQSSSPPPTVEMTNTLTFAPDTIRIHSGQTVRWKNTSVIVHTVTADPDEATLDDSVRLPEEASPFHSGNLDPKDTFAHTFQVPGTYRYFCIPHEGTKMYGTVIVE